MVGETRPLHPYYRYLRWRRGLDCDSLARMFTKILLALMACGMAHAADWVPIKGGVLRPGIRLDDFEMLDHPVTNAEYKLFVDDARYPAPSYSDRGRIPAGRRRPRLLPRARGEGRWERR